MPPHLRFSTRAGPGPDQAIPQAAAGCPDPAAQGKPAGQAPNLSNILALACIKRMRNLDSITPRDPELAPVSVKRSNLSDPLTYECSKTGWGCHECPLSDTGVEWSPVMAMTSGVFCNRIGSAASKSSMAFFLAVKSPSSPALSVYL